MQIRLLLSIILEMFFLSCNGQGTPTPGTRFFYTEVNEPQVKGLDISLLPFKCDRVFCPMDTTRCVFRQEPLPTANMDRYKVLMECLRGDVHVEFLSIEVFKTLVPFTDPDHPSPIACFGPPKISRKMDEGNTNVDQTTEPTVRFVEINPADIFKWKEQWLNLHGPKNKTHM